MDNANDYSNKDIMLKQVMALNFAITDIGLYLNTHPTDTGAIRLHEEFANKYKVVSEEYQRLYGPLTLNYASNNGSTWRWVEEPWRSFILEESYLFTDTEGQAKKITK